MRAARLKRAGQCACALLLGVLTIAQSQAQSGIRVHMHGVDGYAADGLLFVPTSQPPFAAIVLIPDERGITRRITEAGRRFADAGFFTVAVDLNRGMAEQATKRNETEVRQDLDAAFAFIANQSDVRQDTIGAMGWGSGGLSALRLAADSKIIAAAVEDMPLSADSPPLAPMPAAVLAIFAGHDAASSPALVKAFEVRLKPLAKAAEVKVYPKAERGFDEPEDSAHYSPADSSDANRRVVQFFSKMQLR